MMQPIRAMFALQAAGSRDLDRCQQRLRDQVARLTMVIGIPMASLVLDFLERRVPTCLFLPALRHIITLGARPWGRLVFSRLRLCRAAVDDPIR
jgi:hypothetical protein